MFPWKKWRPAAALNWSNKTAGTPRHSRRLRRHTGARALEGARRPRKASEEEHGHYVAALNDTHASRLHDAQECEKRRWRDLSSHKVALEAKEEERAG